MNGIELCRKYWEELGRPTFEARCPEILEYSAAGLVGEGSECLGFDDEISRDHDWGPGFCLLCSDGTPEELVREAADVYAGLPETFMGYTRLNVTAYTEGRVGVIPMSTFVNSYLGLDGLPSGWRQWLSVPESGLVALTNGQVFWDGNGEFSAVRRQLAFYPRDVMLKKLAGHLAFAAQSGQYNYGRCLKRGDKTACALALAQFAEHIQSAVFLLCGRYKPYYKWANKAMAQLGKDGLTDISSVKRAGLDPEAVASALDGIWTAEDARDTVESVSASVIDCLCSCGYSSIRPDSPGGDFLMPHAFEVASSIGDPGLRGLHIMQF